MRPMIQDVEDRSSDWAKGFMAFKSMGLAKCGKGKGIEWTDLGQMCVGPIGSIIRRLREEMNMAQRGLAEQLLIWREGAFYPMDPATLCRIETGVRAPHPEEVVQIACVLAKDKLKVASTSGDEVLSTEFGSELKKYFPNHDVYSWEDRKYIELLNTAKSAVLSAGDMLVEEYWRNARVEQLSDADQTNIVTNADKAAFKQICDKIKLLFPEALIVGEENQDFEGIKDGAMVWLIDSIDGTINFVNGFGFWAVAVVAGTWKEETLVPICAAVYDPIAKELFHALAGGTAMLETGPRKAPTVGMLRVSDEASVRNSVVATHLSATYRTEMETFVGSGILTGLVKTTRRIMMLGSGQLALCALAAGRLQAFINPRTHSWDVLAGKVIVQAAARGQDGRGIVTDYDTQKEWGLTSKGVVAACTTEVHSGINVLIQALK